MPKSPRSKTKVTRVTRALLRRSPLPKPSSDGDKDERGKVLVVGGEVAIPGALILAGIAALRAGAGKLQMATCQSIAPTVGVSVPEAMTIGLDETGEGTISPKSASRLTDLIEKADAVLIGPGMSGSQSESRFVENAVESNASTPLILDAGALDMLRHSPRALHHLEGRAVVTPHALEMARMLNCEIGDVKADPKSTALRAAEGFQCVAALKGSRTFIATPEQTVYCYDAGDVGLATSGSGDTLAGVVAGLLARGTTPLHATMWAVFLHGEAGNRLAKKLGRIGYLARELLDEIPPLMNSI